MREYEIQAVNLMNLREPISHAYLLIAGEVAIYDLRILTQKYARQLFQEVRVTFFSG